MSKKPKDETNTAMAEVSTRIEMSMNDVVNVFVTEYETKLLSRKAELGKEIKAVKNSVSRLKESVIQVLTKQYKKTTKLNLHVTQEFTAINLDTSTYASDNNPISARVAYKVKVPNSSTNYSVDVRVKSTDQKQMVQFNKELETLTHELQEILLAIKDIGRKERQVRGQISRRKLENSGMATLLKDTELQKLVQL